MNVLVGMKRKKKYFYIGKRVELDEPEKVPIHMRDPITKDQLLDDEGKKIPKIDPKTGKPMVISYRHNNDVKKLTEVLTHPEYERLLNYDIKDDELEGVIRVVKKARKSSSKKLASKKTKKDNKTAKVKKVSKVPSKSASKVKTVSKTSTNASSKRSVKTTSRALPKVASKAKSTSKSTMSAKTSKTSKTEAISEPVVKRETTVKVKKNVTQAKAGGKATKTTKATKN